MLFLININSFIIETKKKRTKYIFIHIKKKKETYYKRNKINGQPEQLLHRKQPKIQFLKLILKHSGINKATKLPILQPFQFKRVIHIQRAGQFKILTKQIPYITYSSLQPLQKLRIIIIYPTPEVFLRRNQQNKLRNGF